MAEAFDFIAVDGRPVFLRVGAGCFVRIRDISVIGVGVTSAADGTAAAPPATVAVHMANSSYATFDPSPTPEKALQRAGDLAMAVATAGNMRDAQEQENL